MKTTAIAIVALLPMVMAMGGCGDSSAAPARPSASADGTTPVGAPGAVSVAAGSAVPLGLTRARVEARIGAPASSPQPRSGGFECILYRLEEQPPFVKLQYCFRHGRLKFLSTYAVAR